MTTSYQQNYPTPPYTTSDSRVVMDYGVGSTNPFSNDGSTLNAKYGFSKNGSGSISFDSALGVKCSATSCLTSSTALPGGPTYEGTIYCEFERAAVAEVNIGNSGVVFYDNAGYQTIGAAGAPFGFADASLASDIIWAQLNQSSSDTQRFNTNIKFNAGTTQNSGNICAHASSHAPSRYLDQRFASLIITWRGGNYYVYYDWQFTPTVNTPFSSGPTSALWNRMAICGSFPGPSNPLGNYWVRRLQVTNTFTSIPVAGPLIGILGDSFALRGIAGSPPAGDPTPTVAAVNATQYFYGSPTQRSFSSSNGYYQTFGQSSWCMGLSAAVAENLGFLPNIFMAGAQGHGWSQTLAPFNQSYGDALIQAQPEILICLGSVNDITSATDVSATIGSDTLAKLNYLTTAMSGGTAWASGATQYPKRLRQILFFEAFSWEGITGQQYPNFIPHRKGNWVSQFATLNGQTSNGVPITVVPVCDVGTPGVDAWNTDPAFRTFFDDTTNPNDTASTVGGHPCTTGLVRMADIIAPYLLNVLGRATR